MNQENYKEIAKIISIRNELIDKDDKNDPENRMIMTDILINDLADYFEKEELRIDDLFKKFNKKQFLKDCGVD